MVQHKKEEKKEKDKKKKDGHTLHWRASQFTDHQRVGWAYQAQKIYNT